MPDYDAVSRLSPSRGPATQHHRRVPCDAWEPVESTLQTTERLDRPRLQGAGSDESFVFYFEAYRAGRMPHPGCWQEWPLSERNGCHVSLIYSCCLTATQAPASLAAGKHATADPSLWFREVCLCNRSGALVGATSSANAPVPAVPAPALSTRRDHLSASVIQGRSATRWCATLLTCWRIW